MKVVVMFRFEAMKRYIDGGVEFGQVDARPTADVLDVDQASASI